MNIATTAAADNCELQAPAKAAAADENKAQLALLGGQTAERERAKSTKGAWCQ